MHPVVAPVVPDVALGLGNLVRVVRKRIVDAAAVNVEVFAEVFERDTGAFDVPARIAHTPGRIPLERLVLKL